MATVLGGVTKRIMSRRHFTFGGLAAGQTQTSQAFAHLEVGHHTEAVMLFRFHSLNIMGGASVTFASNADGMTYGDPTATLSSPLGASFFTFTGPVSSPQMALLPLGSANGLYPGRFVIVTVSAVQASPTPVTITMELSIDVTLRGGAEPDGPSGTPFTPRGYVLL